MFSDPTKNLKTCGLREDSIVADFGAGAGHYALAAGGIVTRGKVYAVEVVRDLLGVIKNKARDAHLSNIEVIWGNVEKNRGSKIHDGVVDVVIASNILFQVEDKTAFIDEVKRVLKPKGKVFLTDWLAESPGISDQLVVTKVQALSMFEKKGFTLDREISTGLHHYGMILVKS